MNWIQAKYIPDRMIECTKQASNPNFNSSNTLKYPVPKYNVFTLECGGKVIVVASPSEHVNASDTGFMPTVVAMEIIAGIKIVVRTVLLVKIKCEKTDNCNCSVV